MNKFKSATQKDIAISLGLSVSTVSRVLADEYGIGDETRKAVIAYAKKIGYFPNPAAKKLKGSRSYSIGVLVPELSSSYFSQIINGIESIAHEKGYRIIISQTHNNSEREYAALRQLTAQPIDGILMSLSSGAKDLSHLAFLSRQDIRIVYFDRVPREPDVNKVVVSNHLAAYQATQHLIKMGCRRIAHLTSSPNLLITEERIAGYQEALADHKIQFDPGYLAYCTFGGMAYKEVENAIDHLLNLEEKPTAIFSASDELTLTCLRVFHQKGIDISRDLAFVGFTNHNEATLFNPPITAVSQPAFDMGEKAVGLLIRQIESKHAPIPAETIVLATTFNGSMRDGERNDLDRPIDENFRNKLS